MFGPIPANFLFTPSRTPGPLCPAPLTDPRQNLRGADQTQPSAAVNCSAMRRPRPPARQDQARNPGRDRRAEGGRAMAPTPRRGYHMLRCRGAKAAQEMARNIESTTDMPKTKLDFGPAPKSAPICESRPAQNYAQIMPKTRSSSMLGAKFAPTRPKASNSGQSWPTSERSLAKSAQYWPKLVQHRARCVGTIRPRCVQPSTAVVQVWPTSGECDELAKFGRVRPNSARLGRVRVDGGTSRTKIKHGTCLRHHSGALLRKSRRGAYMLHI